MKHNEIQWIEEIKQGNTAIFAEIYEAYFDEIYSFVAWKIDARQDVEDTVSQIFYKAFNNLSQVCKKENPNIRARLYSIARNCVVDLYRSQKDFGLPQSYDVEDDQVSQLDAAEKSLISATIMHALRKLGDDVHDLFVMRYRQQLSYAEIAAINGKSESNNKKIFSRACEYLRSNYASLSLS